MRLIKPSYEICAPLDGPAILQSIEQAGRTCYKSEDRITEDSAIGFCRHVLSRGHLSVIEHESFSVRFVIDRGVSHELVRHRLCAFSQESTRYCNYRGGVEFIIPPWCAGAACDSEVSRKDVLIHSQAYLGSTSIDRWIWAMAAAEDCYLALLEKGWSPQQARSVLPNSLKTEIVCTANLREWRHILTLRCSPAAHPQMREVMVPLLRELQAKLPVVFDDIQKAAL